MTFIDTEIEGAFIVEPKCFGDARGYFMETFKLGELRERVPGIEFVQDNESLSCRGVLRGLHFQRGDKAQAKLVRVSQGGVHDVIVDLRQDSPSFGKHIIVELTAENRRQLFVPRGCAHGFVVTDEVAQFQYKVDNAYAPEAEATLRFDDPALGINWPGDPDARILSPKDLKGFTLAELKEQNLLF